jgi:hypothetical protein
VARGVYDPFKGQQSPELHMEPSVYGLIITTIVGIKNGNDHEGILLPLES